MLLSWQREITLPDNGDNLFLLFSSPYETRLQPRSFRKFRRQANKERKKETDARLLHCVVMRVLDAMTEAIF
jgi:hypothetical protein